MLCTLKFIFYAFRHEDSPVKRGPGRPRKRKNFSCSKLNINNAIENSAVNSPSADPLENGSLSHEEEIVDEEVKNEKLTDNISEENETEREKYVQEEMVSKT